MPKRNRNHVLLLRHCVRSTRSTIKVCHGVAEGVAAGKGNSTGGKSTANGINNNTFIKRYANLSDFYGTPMPKWDVPSMECTSRGMDIIEDLGRYIVTNVLNIDSTASSSEIDSGQHISVNIISDDSHRDVDTSLALLRGMKEALTNSSFSGLDKIRINKEDFGYDMKSWSDNTTCPTDDDLDETYIDQLAHRLNLLPPSEFHVQEAIDPASSLGAFNKTIDFDRLHNATCPGSAQIVQNLLKYVAEMAFYSRASNINPPFLPMATDEDVYQMLNAADYTRTIGRMDNGISAKKGLVWTKSLLEALAMRADPCVDSSLRRTNNEELVTVTIFVGHDSNINNIATVLGLRWKMPPPYVYTTNDEIGKIVSTPPGSGMIFSTLPESDGRITMSFIAPVNLIGNNASNATIHHQTVPLYTIDMKEPEFAVRDGVSVDGTISMDQMNRRLETTLIRYPELRLCYESVPDTLLGLGDCQVETLSTKAMFLFIVAVMNVVGWSLLLASKYLVTWRCKLKKRYKRVQLDKRAEVQLS